MHGGEGLAGSRFASLDVQGSLLATGISRRTSVPKARAGNTCLLLGSHEALCNRSDACVCMSLVSDSCNLLGECSCAN